jgi:type IV secretory pathway VirB2 component (pilin)
MGRGLATLAICIVGVGALLGKVSWGMAITVAIGISIVFNS